MDDGEDPIDDCVGRNSPVDVNHEKSVDETPRHKLKRWLKENFETNRVQLQEASSNLFFRNEHKSDIIDKYDIIITFSNAIDDIHDLINELSFYLKINYPEMITELRMHHGSEKALYVGINSELLFDKYSLNHQNSKDQSNEQWNDDNQDEKVIRIGENYRKYFPYTHSLSSLQRQNFLINLLNRALFDETNDVDEKFKKLRKFLSAGDCIMNKLFMVNLIDQIFSLHQDDDLNSLKKYWVADFFRPQPLNEICSYFGMRLAIYFAFIGFYTQYLLYPTFFGLFITLFPYLIDYLPSMATIFPFQFLITDNVEYTNCVLLFLFTVFNIFWSSLWLKNWETKCRCLTGKWIEFIPTLKECHQNLHSQSMDDGRDEQNFDVFHFSRKIFKYCVTFPIIGFCLILTFTVMFKIFSFQTWWDSELIEKNHYPEWTGFFPKVIFAVILNIINYLYYLIVTWLNEKEKHYNFELKENQLILKLFLFLNSYLPLFYIAFYLNDVNKLKEQLAAQLITRQVIGNLNETLWPFIKESIRLAWRSSNIPADDPNGGLCKGQLESCMYPYQSTFDDYSELVIQYGYIMLFAPVFPMAPFCAFFNNLIEIRSDAFKLCFVYQRPFDYNQSKTVGVWSSVLNFLSIIAIMSNCALMAVTGHITCLFNLVHPNHVIITSVIVEHILLLIKWFIPVFIPALSEH